MSEAILREIQISQCPVLFSPYSTNRISWCPYTWLNLIPKSIYNSLFNPIILFYLSLSILELYSSSNYSIGISLIIPLSILVFFNLIKDAVYTVWTKAQDEKLNSEIVSV